jgi:plastocyanin
MPHSARRSGMLEVSICLLMVCLIGLSACGGVSGGSGSSPEVDMGVAAFRQSSITIVAGQSVQFVDPANGGGVHVLCIGTNSQCLPQAGAPAILNVPNGVQVSPGDPPIVVTFATKGTYVVVCTIHPGMAVTINVH